jgi:aspartate kinase
LFSLVAASNVSIDMILKNVMREGAAKVSFTVAAADLHQALQAAMEAAREIGATGVVRDGEVAKVSVVGLGMRTHFGVAATMLEVLAQEEITVQMITTGDIKISVLVDRPQAARALRAVHCAFALDTPIDDVAAPFVPGHHARPNMSRVQTETGRRPVTPSRRPWAPAAGLEALVISAVELDDRQGRVTVLDLSDQPGFAARILRRIAEENIFVDMIVQNISLVGKPNLSITVPGNDVERAARAAASVVGAGRVGLETSVAKLTVRGVGMRSHTGVAAHMFRALAEREIAISMINTSEVSINVVTGARKGQEGLECLRRAFLQPQPRKETVSEATRRRGRLAAFAAL